MQVMSRTKKLSVANRSETHFSHKALLLSIAIFVISISLFAESIRPIKPVLSNDFGKTGRREKMTRKTTLKNEGERTVTLRRIKRSCGGCLPISLSRKSVPSGESVVVYERYKSGTKSGLATSKNFIEVDDGKTTYALEVSARWTVEPFLDCRPEEVNFGKKRSDAPYAAGISLLSDGLEGKLELKEAKAASCEEKKGELK